MFARQTPPDLRELLAPNVVAANKVLASLEDTDPDVEIWRNKVFALYPRRISHRLAREYEELFVFSGERAANLYLLGHWERGRQAAIPMQANDNELEQLAKNRANEMRQTAMLIPDDTEAVITLWKLAEGYGITPPSPDDPNITIKGAINRLCYEHWWLRQLRKAHARALEKMAIQIGLVHKFAGACVSEDTIGRYREQKKRNRRYLSKMLAINEHDQVFTLEELSASGVSNPKNRRSELMARLFGFETIATELGHVAEFYTLTCPSRMHARLSKSGKANPKYGGTPPREAQDYLCNVWARIRPRLDRLKIEVYGIRIVEPHQDGTPHWHILLFTDPKNIEPLRSVFQHYAMLEDNDEVGAAEHRFTYRPIDKAKGSAIGYIAKYVSKNIDGYGLTEEDEGAINAKDKAERVITWASTWGIRQFQQFGGPPVSIWRELRRASGEVPEGVLNEAFEAADKGDWAGFLQVMGGPTVKRKDMPILLAKVDQQETGIYGDQKTAKVVGVMAGAIVLPTRLHQWTVMIPPQSEEQDPKIWAAQEARRSRERVCTDARAAARRADALAA